ncbi:MAG: hypothetical protein IJN70_01195 [Clostridia bacterium]|nr:hypothetical protein [Clostridia bacterium]
MAENDEKYRTFVHLAQKNLQIRSDILPENPCFRLDFAEQMCYNMQRKDEHIYKNQHRHTFCMSVHFIVKLSEGQYNYAQYNITAKQYNPPTGG